MSYLFEMRDVPVRATAFMGDLMAEGRGGCIFGPLGSGTSHAARAAVQGKPGALQVHVANGPLLGQRFLADVARQLGTDGRPVLEALRREGVKAALAVAERAVNGHPFVVDEAHLLLGSPQSLEDPATALWQEEKSTLLGWLRERLERTPTFLVGQRRIPGVVEAQRHHTPGDWPIVLQKTPDGYRDWRTLGDLARGNPAVLKLAAALVPWLSANDFNDLVAQARDDDATERELLRRLGQAFRSCAPPAVSTALALVAAIGEVPRDAILDALDAPACAALDALTRSSIIERRPLGLSVLPALFDATAIRALTAQERAALLPAVARRLVAPINDLRSLEPEHADRVLRAHTIFVDLGDMAAAERTATLHVHGLVDLARRTSLERDYPRAWQQYDALWRLLQSGTYGVADETGQHLASYVQHYRAWNGQRAGSLDDAACLDEYTASLRRWPENALWHQRATQARIRLGRIVEVRGGLEAAYRSVPDHPRRDELLRARPARTALAVVGLEVLSLELLEPVLDHPAELHPDLAVERDELLGAWARGISLVELSYCPTALERVDLEGLTQGRLVFLRPTRVSVGKTQAGWVARLPELGLDARGHAPLAAVDALGADLARAARHLISTPSPQLGDRDLRRKGSVLSLVDALNSDIGLEHAEHRWLIGRIDGARFYPTMRDLPATEIPAGLLPESTEGLYFARVPVHRDGAPRGPVERIEPAGRGRTIEDLLTLLARMSEEGE